MCFTDENKSLRGYTYPQIYYVFKGIKGFLSFLNYIINSEDYTFKNYA